MIYEMRIAESSRGDTIEAPTKREAIKKFLLNNPPFKYPDGSYDVEIRGKGIFRADLKTIQRRECRIERIA